jgi:translocation and assembly module TamB
VVGVAAGGWWAWRFVQNDLAPLVAENLSGLFDRPVEVGEIKGISLNSITIGESAIPATATDPDRASVPEIVVHFNPLQALWERTLDLDVTLNNPDVYIEQNAEGMWVSTTLKQEEGGPEPIVKIQLDTLRVRDSNLRLAPYVQPESEPTAQIPSDVEIVPHSEPAESAPESKSDLEPDPVDRPVLAVNAVNGEVTFREENQLIGLDIVGKPQTGGNLDLKGQIDLSQNKVALQVNTNDVQGADIGLLVPLPIKLEGGRLDTNLNVQLPVSSEKASGQAEDTGAELAGDEFDPLLSRLFLNGTVRFQDGAARLAALPKSFTRLYGGLRFRDQEITFQEVRGRYGAIPARVGGSLNFLEGYNLNIRAQGVTIADLLSSFDVEAEQIPIELAGEFRSEIKVTGAIDQPVLTGIAQNSQVLQVDRIGFERATTRFTITPEAFTINEFAAQPQDGGQLIGTGKVQFGDEGGIVFDIRGENLPGDSIASAYAGQQNLVIGNVNATAQVFGSMSNLSNIQTVVQWQAPQASYPGRGRVAIARDTIRFEDTVLLVAGGLVQGEGLVAQGQWQANVRGSGVELSQFSPDLRGLLSGDFRLSGSLEDLSPEAIRAEGNVAFSEGLALINDRLTVSVRWLGDRVQIVQANAPGFNADGFIGVQLADTPGISNLDLNVQVQNYALTDLPTSIPPNLTVAGTADFDGAITGTLDAINVAGSLGLNHLAVNELAFESRLAGTANYGLNRGLALDIAGTQDRIVVNLDGQNRPNSFLIRQGETLAQGQRQGDRLLAALENFPLEVLNLAPAGNLGLGRVGGVANGRFDINIADLSNPAVVGEVAIAQPSLDYISADALTAKFRYFGGAAVLEAGELRQGGSRYLLSGTYNPDADTLFQGKVTAAAGRVEDLFAALQWFELADLSRGVERPVYAGAAEVETIAVGMPDATILNQLQRYSEIVELRNQEIAQQEAAEILPALSTLQGEFTGDIDLAYSAQTGPEVRFALSGQEWNWGEYAINQVVAQGGFQNGILTLLPFQVQTDQSFLRFTGQVGGEQQSGQLIAQNVPVEALQELGGLPFDVQGGVLNANAFLTGSISNPQVIGEVLLDDVTLNNVTAPPFRTLFGYSNARLQVESRVLDTATVMDSTDSQAVASETSLESPIVKAEPTPRLSPESQSSPSEPNVRPTTEIQLTDETDDLRFTASIPYRFPFMTVEPERNDFNINLNIRNDGLALLSLFTDQVVWQGGQGNVQLQARGLIDQTENSSSIAAITTTGSATFQDAVFSSKNLPENITNVTGTVVFNGDRIQVQQLDGQFSNGKITAQGTLPILLPLNLNDPTEEQPLTIGMDNLGLNLEDLYDGKVDGQVIVQRTALAPLLTGTITVRDGRVLLGGRDATAPEAALAATTASEAPGGSLIMPPEFEDLQIVLGNRLRVVQTPILNFLVSGELLINGTQEDLQPEGTVRLNSGQVNLFTTIFNLDRDYDNVATFSPNRGLDPVLNVHLVASVPEVTRAPIVSTTSGGAPLAGSDVADTPAFEYGELQTIRVEASVVGPASQIYNNLELTSSPRRTESEIVGLLGGGFVDTLGQGNEALAIANLAGSTILTRLQNLISDATGLTDFRLFSTNVLSDNERSSTLALAAELGFDLTQGLSVSLLQILTAEEPTRFSLRYQLNDQFTLRGSTDTEGNSQAILEFVTRF